MPANSGIIRRENDHGVVDHEPLPIIIIGIINYAYKGKTRWQFPYTIRLSFLETLKVR